MELASTGVEYVYFTVFSDNPILSQPTVGFTRSGHETDSGTVWNLATWVSAPDTSRELKILVAGSSADPVPDEAVVLAKGKWQCWVKFSENPETVIRPAAVVLTMR